MTLEELTLDSLATMDCGRVGVAFQQALRRCYADCQDRPEVKDARKITLTVTLEPVAEGGKLDSVDVTSKLTDSIPKRCSRPYNMRAVRGGLVFQDLSPEDVDQGTFDFDLGPRAEEPVDEREEAADVG